MKEMENAYRILFGKPERKRLVGRPHVNVILKLK